MSFNPIEYALLKQALGGSSAGDPARYAVDIPDDPTQGTLTALYEAAAGTTDPPPDGVKLVDTGKKIAYTWFKAQGIWSGPESDENEYDTRITNLETSVSGKLDKVSAPTATPRAYVVTEAGNQAMLTITSESYGAYLLAQRNANGSLVLPTAQATNEAVPLGQMNTALGGKVDKAASYYLDHLVAFAADGAIKDSAKFVTSTVRPAAEASVNAMPNEIAVGGVRDALEAKKLDKVTSQSDYTRSYVVTSTGTNALQNIAQDPVQYTVPARTSSGAIKAADAANANECVPLGQMTNAINAAVAQLQSGGRGPRPVRVVVGSADAGYTAADVDFLCDGTDDEVELEAAIDALPSGAGGMLKILDGTYFLSRSLTIARDGITVEGSGAPNTILRMVGARTMFDLDTTNSVMYVTGNNNTVSGLTFATDTTPTEGASIGLFVAGSDHTIRDNLFANRGGGTVSGKNLCCGLLLANCQRCLADGNRCTTEATGNGPCYGVLMQSNSYYNTCSNNFIDNYSAGYGYGIACDGSSRYNIIKGNEVRGSAADVEPRGSWGVSLSASCVAEGNLIANNAPNGRGTGISAAAECTVSGNVIATQGKSCNGVDVTNAGSTVAGNNIACSSNGDTCRGIFGGSTSARFTTISGNAIRAQSSAQPCYGISIASEGNTIVGNLISSRSSSAQTYGIRASGANNVISNNTFSSNRQTITGFALYAAGSPDYSQITGNNFRSWLAYGGEPLTQNGSAAVTLPGTSTTIEAFVVGTNSVCGFNMV
jgi:hypothetical protein